MISRSSWLTANQKMDGFELLELVSMYHRWGVLDVAIDGVVSECENENYDCYLRMEYRSLPRNYMLSLTLS
jgi:hypothetical protein